MRKDQPVGQRGRRRARVSGAIGVAAIVAAALFATTACSGCFWLAVPSLAYQGYKAEQPANQSGQNKARSSSQQSQGQAQYDE
ncbi:MAG TPA: hypothetical protein VFB33_14225 [Candidatus Binataceae bacterium]|jgi:hypothetical protein|nr:hypothetical protein [Candidatus Binataceae bacterium]